MISRAGERGQATVELGVSLIMLTLVLLLLLQVGLVARDQVLVTQAAREAARTAAVEPDSTAAVAAAVLATGLSSNRMSVDVGPRPDEAGMVGVEVVYRSRILFPGVNRIITEPRLAASAAMKIEAGS